MGSALNVDPPLTLNQVGRDEWRRIFPLLRITDFGLADLAALETYCSAYSRYHEVLAAWRRLERRAAEIELRESIPAPKGKAAMEKWNRLLNANEGDGYSVVLTMESGRILPNPLIDTLNKVEKNLLLSAKALKITPEARRSDAGQGEEDDGFSEFARQPVKELPGPAVRKKVVRKKRSARGKGK